MVGRQPIFDTKFDVWGYELLFRDPHHFRPGGDTMTADVLVRAGLDIGLDDLVGDKLAFVNATRPFLVGDQEIPFPPERTVVEIMESVSQDARAFAGCRELARQGYTLALDNYVWSPGDDPLLELVDIVKLNVLDLTPVQLVHEVERCRAFDLKLVAERVETQDKMSFCRQLGFDLFQGYLLSRAEVVKGQSLNPRRATCLRLIEELCNPETSAGEIQRIVETDGALSYRFLRLAGEGAAGGLRRRLSSVREGVVMLGHRRLRAWVMIMLLSDVHAGSTEQLNIAMARARMCELIALSVEPRLADSAFTVGLVSALDLLLGAPLPRILKDLSLTEELVNALLDHDGRLGRMLADVLAWETGGGELRPQCGLTLDGLEKCYLEALAWSTSVCGELEPVA